ncbi:hypothetical protein PSTT_03077, partial [Puccinia striiformis]
SGFQGWMTVFTGSGDSRSRCSRRPCKFKFEYLRFELPNPLTTNQHSRSNKQHSAPLRHWQGYYSTDEDSSTLRTIHCEELTMPLGLVGQPLLYTISIFASLGVFLFGYDQGVMSGIITGPYFKAFFHQPTRYELGTMVAILELEHSVEYYFHIHKIQQSEDVDDDDGFFRIVTSIISGRIGDVFGRRKTLSLALSSSLSAVYCNLFVLVSPRWSLGESSLVSALGFYLRLFRSINLKSRPQIILYGIYGKCSRICSLSMARLFLIIYRIRLVVEVPSIFPMCNRDDLMIGSFLIPESPRWLLDTDQDRAGMRVLVDLNGGDPRNIKARQEYIEIKEAVLDDRIAPDRSYLAMWTRYRVEFYWLCLLKRLLNWSSAGWIGRDAILMTGINGTVYVFSTIPTWYLVMNGGVDLSCSPARSSWLSVNFYGLVLIYGYHLYTLSGSFLCINIQCINIGDLFNSVQFLIFRFFGYSWGPIPWLYPPEIMPLPFRVKGVSISTATNWFFNYLVGEATPVLQDAIRWRLYPMHACFCVISFILEDMDELFGDVGQDHENQSLVNSERSSIQRALEPPDLTLPPPLEEEEEDLTTTGCWVDRVFKFGNNNPGRNRDRIAYQTAAPDDH